MTLHDFFGRPVEVSPWDGVTPWGKRLPYPSGGLYIGSASRLEGHVHHLQQIAAR